MKRTLLQIPPILAALRRHKTAAVLLALEIALTMAVLTNLFFIVRGSVQLADTPTGIDENAIGVIQSIGVIGAKSSSSQGTVGNNLAVLRSVPGVADAAFGGPPLWDTSRAPVFLHASRQTQVGSAYLLQGSQGFSHTLGLKVVQGHGFNDNDLPDVMAIFGDGNKQPVLPVLITRALAHKLYGGANPLGRTLYVGQFQARVIGVLAHLRGEITGRRTDDDSIVAEFHASSQHLGGGFVIRARDPARLTETLRAAAAALQKANPDSVQAKVFTFPLLRHTYFQSRIASSRMLVAIVLILLVVTALGVSGLASFWVQQRTRQIGMRRALGATRGDILHYFQMENFLIVTAGVLAGVACGYGLNLLLMQHFQVPRLPAGYVVVGAVVLWVLGQLAVLAPALRASRVPPVVATRSV
ncbi:MAG TPA: FtsX-like permease family protein [Rhodanobacteraceae bacterium]